MAVSIPNAKGVLCRIRASLHGCWLTQIVSRADEYQAMRTQRGRPSSNMHWNLGTPEALYSRRVSLPVVPCTLRMSGNRSFCRMARKAVSLRCPFGDQARAVESAPLFKAPLFRLGGILGRVRTQILCTRLIDAEPLLRGSEEKALK
jgi:hypothetical protein